MRIMIFSAFDPVPSDRYALVRYGWLVKALLEQKHEVHYIAASFFHLEGKQRKSTTYTDAGNPKGLIYTLLPSPSYTKVQLHKRLLSYTRLAKNLRTWQRELSPAQYPDAILCAYPPVGTGYYLSKWAKEKSIPFILDIQDLWPEEWERLVKPEFMAKILFRPWYMKLYAAVENACALASISSDLLNRLPEKIHSKPEAIFHLGTDTSAFHPPKESLKDRKKIVCMSSALDMGELLKLLKAVKEQDNIELHIVGLGGRQEKIRQKLQDHLTANIHLHTWWSMDEMTVQLRDTDAGIVIGNEKSMLAMPNRVFNYLAAGVPIVSNVKGGELENVLAQHQLGITVVSRSIEDLRQSIQQCLLFTLEDRKRIATFAHLHMDSRNIYKKYAEWLLEQAVRCKNR